MQANELLECRNTIIEAFKNGTFKSKHLKDQIMLLMVMC